MNMAEAVNLARDFSPGALAEQNHGWVAALNSGQGQTSPGSDRFPSQALRWTQQTWAGLQGCPELLAASVRASSPSARRWRKEALAVFQLPAQPLLGTVSDALPTTSAAPARGALHAPA